MARRSLPVDWAVFAQLTAGRCPRRRQSRLHTGGARGGSRAYQGKEPPQRGGLRQSPQS
jgi:hypothetical protein